MDLTEMVASVKKRPDYGKVGMIVCHNGVVRGTSRDGRVVTELEVTVDRGRLEDVIAEVQGRNGIIDALAEVCEGKLKVGDDIMRVVVAGDIRENTFPALEDMVNAIKRHVLMEKEIE